MSFSEKLQNSWRQFDSLLMVGLDPDPARIPMDLATSHDGLLEFCCRIIEATAPYSCGFKPQIAYFSSIAAEPVLEKVCAFIRDQYPDHVLVLDSKRGDIGSTAEQY